MLMSLSCLSNDKLIISLRNGEIKMAWREAAVSYFTALRKKNSQDNQNPKYFGLPACLK
jgi:hypothetical protein